MGPLALGLIVWGGWPFVTFIMLAAAIALYEWHGLVASGKFYIPRFLLGVVYLSLCISSFVFLRFAFDGGLWFAVAVIVCVAASDTAAYIAGKTIGGAKMAPVLSPKKTWAGLAGALLACGLALMGLGIALPLFSAPLWEVFVAGCLMGFAGQTGDLFISSFKRQAGLKDTGNLIPGHGGLLDRIDSLLLVSPTFLLVLELWLR